MTKSRLVVLYSFRFFGLFVEKSYHRLVSQIKFVILQHRYADAFVQGMNEGGRVGIDIVEKRLLNALFLTF